MNPVSTRPRGVGCRLTGCGAAGVLLVGLGACSSGVGTATVPSTSVVAPATASTTQPTPSTPTTAPAPTSVNGAIPSLTLPAGTGGPLTAAPSSPSAGEVRAAVTQLLTRRATALAARDRGAWMSTVADPAGAYGVRQAGVYDVMAALPVTRWKVESVDAVPVNAQAQQWRATVHQSYLLRGFDTAPRDVQTVLTVRRTAEQWAVVDDGLGPAARTSGSQAQPWDLPGARVVSSGDALVVGNLPLDTLQGYLQLARDAGPQVAAAWGSAGPAVIVAPSSLAELADQLRRTGPDPTAGLTAIAAITDGPVARGVAASSDRVYLNPDAFAKLTAQGRQEVVTHELTHVAVRASTTAPVPMWLSEGFADYVGFAHLGLADSVVAADLVSRIRQGHGPAALPADAAFDGDRASAGDLGVAYNAAWLAVKRLVARFGLAKTAAVYRQVATQPSSTDPATALRRAFSTDLGVTQDAFVADWLATLSQLAS